MSPSPWWKALPIERYPGLHQTFAAAAPADVALVLEAQGMQDQGRVQGQNTESTLGSTAWQAVMIRLIKIQLYAYNERMGTNADKGSRPSDLLHHEAHRSPLLP